MRAFTIGLAAAVLFLGCGDDDGGTNNQNENNGQSDCGNEIVEPGEACDDGSSNSDVEPDACRSDCRNPYCGDSVVDSAEVCDDGTSNSDLFPDACRTTCQVASCGDGTVDSDETCDDGNAAPGDGCDAACQVEPFWACSGRPSVCECEPYHRGADCRECVVYVSVDSAASEPDGLTWATAFQRVQQGIDAAHGAGPHCDVWVVQGSYDIYEFSPTNSVKLRDYVGVYGGFAGTETQRAERDWENNETILWGRGPDFNRVYHVVEADTTLDATLDGFTITGGSAFGQDSQDQRGAGISTKGSRITVANCSIWGNRGYDGSGMANEGSSVVVQSTWFADNTVSNRGGAMFNNGGTAVLSDCTFTNNEGQLIGGAIYSGYANLTVSGCEFNQNGASDSGGAMYAISTWMTVTDTLFVGNYIVDPPPVSDEGNRGGAVYFNAGVQTVADCTFDGNDGVYGGGLAAAEADTTVTGCTFTGNNALQYGGAVYILSGSARIESSLLAANVAWGGGALYNDQSSSTLVGCTIADNGVGMFGGGVSNVWGGIAELTNCILWGNFATSEFAINTFPLPPDINPSQTLLLHNNIQNNFPWGSTDQGGNVYGNPAFVDALGGDYHLGSGSVCIDAGWGDATVPLLDLDGNPRVDLGQSGANGGAGTPDYIDMGAYERQN